MNFPKTAFLLGAGLGTRLRPLTEHCPKPLLPLGGQPMICRAMDALLALGIERFIINTHHAAEVYTEKFPRGNWRGAPVTLVHEPVLLDTGGGLKNIDPLLVPADENLLVYNGDILADLDLEKLAAAHAENGALATLLLRTDKLGNVNVSEQLRSANSESRMIADEKIRNSQFAIRNSHVLDDLIVEDMRDRLGVAGTRRCRFTGIYIVSRRFFNEIPAGKTESVVEAFLRVIARGNGEIRGVIDDAGTWRDLGTPEEYRAACAEFSATAGTRTACAGEEIPPQEKFSGRAEHYDRARPAYAETLIVELCAKLKIGAGTAVADIGAGTGIFAEQLLRRGCEVFGVEPNGDMRAVAEKRLAAFPNFHAVSGDAARTGLPDGAAEIVTAAQAFHWFPAEAFRAECARISRRKIVALVYNRRTAALIHEDARAVLKRFCPQFRDYGGAMKETRISDFFRGKFTEISAPNPVSFDAETFLRRLLSASYALRERDENFADFVQAIRGVFSRHEKNGRVAFPLETVAYTGRVD